MTFKHWYEAVNAASLPVSEETNKVSDQTMNDRSTNKEMFNQYDKEYKVK